MGLRRKDNGIWMYDYTDATGKRRRETTGTRDHAIAKRRAKLLDLGLPWDDDEPTTKEVKPERPVTVADLLRYVSMKEWNANLVKSQATIKSNVRLLEKHLGAVAVKDITGDTILNLQHQMLNNGKTKPGTVKRKLDTLYKALREALKWDGGNGSGKPLLVSLPERPKLAVKNWRDRIVSAAEFAQIDTMIQKRIKCEPTRDWARFRALVWFLRYTGCRLSEALDTRLDSITLKGNRHWVSFARYQTKNDKPRVMPLAIQILPHIEVAKARMFDDRLFPIRPATAWYMWDGLRQELLEAGWNMDDVTLHTFRHTCITELLETVPIQKVSLWAGHSSVEITLRRYGHLVGESFLDCVDALDDEKALGLISTTLQ